MKNIFTFLILLVSMTSLSAQIQKGTVLLGGTVAFQNISVEGSGVTIVNLAPTAGFFLSDRFALGASLGMSLLVNNGGNFTSFGLAPYARYYFNGSGKARFFGEASIGISSDKSEGFDALNTLQLGLALGADFFLNDNVAIEGSLGYVRSNYLETDSPVASSGINTIGLNFGVIAFIGRKKKE